MPMVYRVDLSISQDLFTNFMGKRNTLQFRVDFLNFTNLLNKDWGVSQRMASNQPLVIPSAGAVGADGKMVYRLRNISGKLMSKTFEDNASIYDVFRIQFGLRYNFN